MDIVIASKNAPMHELTKIGDGYNFNLQLAEEQQPHWEELRRAIRTARRDGFAYFELGGFVGYSLIYNATGVTEEVIKSSPIPRSRRGSDAQGNRRTGTASLSPPSQTTRRGRIQRRCVATVSVGSASERAIQDILRNRLLIMAAYNARIDGEAPDRRRADREPCHVWAGHT